MVCDPRDGAVASGDERASPRAGANGREARPDHRRNAIAPRACGQAPPTEIFTVAMPSDSSFDIVSEINLQEMDNAVNQAVKEIATRYDFKGTGRRRWNSTARTRS